MLGAVLDKLKDLAGEASARVHATRRHRPIQGDSGRPADVEHVFKAKRYRGSRDRAYHVHLPPAHGRGRRLPVVMILHGCDQDHRAIRHVSDFDRLADRHGVIVVYPFVTSYDTPRMRNCWAFWSNRHNRAGAGEVEDLWQILREVRARYGADASRLHVAGLSSGAGMAITLLVNRCDKIASGAAIAGVSYTEGRASVGLGGTYHQSTEQMVAEMNERMGRKKRRVPLMIVHAKRDRVVSVEAATKIRDAFASSFGVSTSQPSWSESGTTNGTAWDHRRYTDEAGGSAIETLLLDHRGHGWYGGRNGKYGFANAPDVNAKICAFFESTPLSRGARLCALLWSPLLELGSYAVRAAPVAIGALQRAWTWVRVRSLSLLRTARRAWAPTR